MKITMISNYINHHQIPFSDALYNRLGNDYHFIQTEKMEQKRIDMGWEVNPDDYPYVILSYQSVEEARKAINESDVLLVGWLEDESIIADRLRNGKLVLRISERLYREGQWKFLSPKGLIKKYKEHISLNKYPVYLLCNGAYVASDYNLIHAYSGKKYKLGYFPKARIYEDYSKLAGKKASLNIIKVDSADELPEEPPVLTDNEVQIVWAGRFIELKHPEYMVRLAADLVNKGYRFHIHMIGSGVMEEELKALAADELLEDYITFHGSLLPEDVRDIMETCHIQLFTSNFLEGWGAVVNEGMNAGLTVIANEEVGAAPFLVENGVNGLMYKEGRYESMLAKVVSILENPKLIDEYGRAAYETITSEWNAEEASNRVIEFCEGWIKGTLPVYESGPLSIAGNLKPRFFASGTIIGMKTS